MLGRATRAEIPCSVSSLEIDCPSDVNTTASLSLREAIYTSTTHCETNGAAGTVGAGPVVTSRAFAHRTIRSALVRQVTLSRADGADTSSELSVGVSSAVTADTFAALTGDVDFKAADCEAPGAYGLAGRLSRPENERACPDGKHAVAVVATEIPPTLTLAAGQREASFEFIMIARSSLDVGAGASEAAVYAAAEADYNATLATPFDDLVQSHTAAWAELWRSGVELVPKEEAGAGASLARRVNSTLYYLYSTMREDKFAAPSPGLLGTNFDGYNGNAFWDSEVWIANAVLPFAPELAHADVQYRLLRLTEALEEAEANEYPEGAAYYPWQSAGCEREVDLFHHFNLLEKHVGPGIVMLVRNLYYQLRGGAQGPADGADSFLNATYPMLKAVADFVVGTATPTGAGANADVTSTNGSLSILNVVGPDEFGVG